MPDSTTLALFAAATAALLLVPGPSVLFIVARTLEHGRRGGLVSMLGVEAGALLLAMGVRAFRRPHEIASAAAADAGCSPGRLFRQGVLVDALNPKTAMFFLAFLPQFVDPGAGAVAGQTLVLGLCFVALATLSDGGYALLAGAVAERLRRSAVARDRLRRVSGAAYLGLGALTGLSPA
jgi:threonine/homoserine/homoserine lactone efflux protein